MNYFTIDELINDNAAKIIMDYHKIPDDDIYDMLENKKSSKNDVYTPMKKGPHWLYEELAIYQPKTAALLKNSPLYINQYKGYENYNLFQVINRQIIQINRRPYGYNTCDKAYKETDDLMTLWKSLPEALQKAYFHKFNGLEMLLSRDFCTKRSPLVNGFQLINWNGRPLGAFLKHIHKRKYLEKCHEFFNMGPKYLYSKPHHSGALYYDTKSYRLWPFLEHFHQEPYTKNHDYLCILRDNEKSPIYYFKDGNLENLYEIPRETITEAMDDYHHHILSGAKKRFRILGGAKKRFQFLDYAHEVKEWKS